MPTFDADWKRWLNDNVARGCSRESMLSVMVDAGFDTNHAASEVARALAADPDANPADPCTIAHSTGAAPNHYHYDAMPVASGNHIDVGDRVVDVLIRSERPQIIVFANLLSDEECDELIARSRAKLERSTTIDPATGESIHYAGRSSEGTYFDRAEDELITRIEQRIEKLMNWPAENGEGLQVLRYGPSGEYKPHYDYFPPQDPGSAKHTGTAGQRVSTLLFYLSGVEAGGETIFPHAGVSVVPRKGAAVYFRYCNAQGQLDSLSLHGGAPVLAGEKWIMTKWMRQGPYTTNTTESAVSIDEAQ